MSTVLKVTISKSSEFCYIVLSCSDNRFEQQFGPFIQVHLLDSYEKMHEVTEWARSLGAEAIFSVV